MRALRRPMTAWTTQLLAAEAAMYACRGDFKRKAKYAYEAARRRDILDQICGHMHPDMTGVYFKSVYIIRAINKREAYIGITYNVDWRYGIHVDRGTAAVKAILSQPHRLLVVAERRDPAEAVWIEGELIARFAAAGWALANQSGAGSVGRRAVKWTADLVGQEARRYSARSAFARGSEAAYRRAIRFGILDEVCRHMKPRHQEWTAALAVAEARKYATRTEFCCGNPYAWRVAVRLGVLEVACAHMPKLSGAVERWRKHREATNYGSDRPQHPRHHCQNG